MSPKPGDLELAIIFGPEIYSISIADKRIIKNLLFEQNNKIAAIDYFNRITNNEWGTNEVKRTNRFGRIGSTVEMS